MSESVRGLRVHCECLAAVEDLFVLGAVVVGEAIGVSEPGTCRTVGATGTGRGAVRVSRNGCRYPTKGLVAAPIAQRRDLCGEGGGVGVPGLKRLHECETVIATEHTNVSPACPRPAAHRPRAWRP